MSNLSTRVTNLLKLMPEDGEWSRVNLMQNIGRKTIEEAIAVGAIERERAPAGPPQFWKYRRAGVDEWLRHDLGDLWVPV